MNNCFSQVFSHSESFAFLQAQYNIFTWSSSILNTIKISIIERKFTVKPLLSGPLLSGHPLLNGHFSNSQKSVPLFTVNLTSTPFGISNWLILLYFSSIKRSRSQLQCDILTRRQANQGWSSLTMQLMFFSYLELLLLLTDTIIHA